jgi:two-component system, cell cycle response regulator
MDSGAAGTQSGIWPPRPPGVTQDPVKTRSPSILMASAAVALALLGYSLVSPLEALAVGSAAITLAVVLLRMSVALRERSHQLAHSREEALTDSLTGLGNRRRLLADLDRATATAREDAPRALLLLDLDGFKVYNDRYGHPAGDALLTRLGARLAGAAAALGRAYRLGGDEFCVIALGGDEEAQALAGACTVALSDHHDGVDITSSYGLVILPRDARDSAEALKQADQRVYAQKGRRQRFSVSRQTGNALLQALHERDPRLRAHLGDVAELAIGVGHRLGLTDDGLDDLVCAAELHDVGKVGVPNEILQKRGPLDDVEWAVMHDHTIAGDRILSAAPALSPVAKIVRSSHERYDGLGYPDGLSGAKIPLGARIIAVCDAYDAMTTDRPYRRAVGSEDALAELCRCAGYQFDPDVVAAFCEAIESPSWGIGDQRTWRAARAADRTAAALA